MNKIYFLLYFCLSMNIWGENISYPFENKKYTVDAELSFNFTNGFFEYHNSWYDQWGEAGLGIIPITISGPYEIHQDSGLLYAETELEDKKRKIFIFYEGDHAILYDSYLHKTIYGSSYSQDDAYIYPGPIQGATSYFSEILNGKEISYLPENLSNRDITKPWVEGAEGVGIGEKIFLGPYSNRGMNHIVILNGFFSPSQPGLYYDNGRIKSFILRGFDEKGRLIYEGEKQLDDSANLQLINSAIRCNSFEIEILNVYPGRRFEDTAISGIFYDGYLIAESLK